MFSYLRLAITLLIPIMGCNVKRNMVQWVRNERKHPVTWDKMKERNAKRLELATLVYTTNSNCFQCDCTMLCTMIKNKIETVMGE